MVSFQSTHPHGVRLISLVIIRVWLSFNPRTHMGCDAAYMAAAKSHDVSIHAPTWGATYLPCVPFFLHACFNPRTHMGCDVYKDENGKTQIVSIHAPTWGATHIVIWAYQNHIVSIHAPTWGATKLRQSQSKLRVFQSTHPHGVRHAYLFGS